MRSAVLNNGAVAQLGERQNRTLEVGGSTPLCSTKKRRGQAIFKKLLVPFFLSVQINTPYPSPRWGEG